ncbi:altronate hydrolase [Sphingomonas deserti]|uniref:Altronate hydrolase n=2 Tax=Allosphingosinicella deserti TaxID=2116704 RepID=A0A2P7QGS5_9SPHN|nr:altronate hydrolase [Sphingomonas deserti]
MTTADGPETLATSRPNAARLLLLDARDNVLVCTTPIAAGDPLPIGDETVVAPVAIAVGHKVARHALAPGDKVIKHGAPIGSANRAIAPGDWIHLHNLDSDYIPTHSRKTVSTEE